MPHDIFITHASGDAAAALLRTLEERGLRCWIQSRDHASDALHSDDVAAAISSAAVVVLLLSSQCAADSRIKRELNLAVHHDRKLLVVELEKCPLSKSLQYMLSLGYWVESPADLDPPALADVCDKAAALASGQLDGMRPGRLDEPAVVAPQRRRPGRRVWQPVAAAASIFLGIGAAITWTHIGHKPRTRAALPPAPAAQAAPPAAIASFQPRTVDLMPLIDPVLDSFTRGWQKSGSALDGDAAGKLRIVYQPPEEYDFRVEFECRSNGGAGGMPAGGIGQGFWAGGKFHSYSLGSSAGAYAIFGSPDNPMRATLKARLEPGKRYVSELKIRRDGVSAYLNSELVAEMAGSSLHNDRSRGLWGVGDAGLSVAGFNSSPRVFKIAVVEQSGAGHVVPRPAPQDRALLRSMKTEFIPSLNWDAAIVRYSPDGQFVVAGHNGKFVAFGTETGARTLGAVERVVAMSECGTSTYLFARHGAARGSLYNLAKTKEIAGVDNVTDGVAISPDNRYLVTAADGGSISIWGISDGGLTRLRERPSSVVVNGLHFSPDGSRLLAISNRSGVTLFDANSLEKLWGTEQIHFNAATGCFSPDGTRILGFDGTAGYIFDSNGRIIDLLRAPPGCDGGRAIYSPDGHYLLTWFVLHSTMPQLTLRDAATGTQIPRFTLPIPDVHSAAFTPDGRRLLAGCADGVIRLFDVETGNLIDQFGGGHGQVCDLACCPRGDQFAVLTADLMLRFYRIDANVPPTTAPAHRSKTAQ